MVEFRPVLRLYLGVLGVYALFHGVAVATGSTLGEWGIPIALVVVAATAGAAATLPLAYEGRPVERVRALGLAPTADTPRALALTAGVAALMLAFYPTFAVVTGADLALRARWWAHVPGLFAQAGVAEETLFRGYLFGQLRASRSYRAASLASVPPFALAHVALFFTMEPAIAIAALVLAVSTSFPLARLHDLGGRSIWAPALLHFVIQAAPKLIVAPGLEVELGVGWMAVAAVVPWAVLLVPARAR